MSSQPIEPVPDGEQVDIFAAIAEAESDPQRQAVAAARRATLVAVGRAERDAGMQLADESVDDFWRSTVDQAIRAFADSGQPFNADDLREAGVPDPHGKGRSQNAWGMRFLVAKRAGLIVEVGRRTSRRASVHAHRVAVYVGADHAHRYPHTTF